MATRRKPASAAPPPQESPGTERTLLPIHQLSRAAYNPRRISDRSKAALRKSLGEFGMVQEIVVNVRPDGELRVVGGHQRLDILEEDHGRGHEVPVVLVRLSDAREKLLNLTLNNREVGGEYTRDVDRLVADLESSDDVDAAMRDSLLVPNLLEQVTRDDASAVLRSLEARRDDAGDDDDDDDAMEAPAPRADPPAAAPTPAAEPEPASKPAQGTGTGETRGLGKPVISYQIVFDDEAQQERFYAFLRTLRDRYGDDCPTISARLDRFVQDSEHVWKQF